MRKLLPILLAALVLVGWFSPVTAQVRAGLINLATMVTGTLPVANGGTGVASLGADTRLLFNNAGVVGSDANLTWNGTTLAANLGRFVPTPTDTRWDFYVGTAYADFTPVFRDRDLTHSSYVFSRVGAFYPTFNVVNIVGENTLDEDGLIGLTVQATTRASSFGYAHGIWSEPGVTGTTTNADGAGFVARAITYNGGRFATVTNFQAASVYFGTGLAADLAIGFEAKDNGDGATAQRGFLSQLNAGADSYAFYGLGTAPSIFNGPVTVASFVIGSNAVSLGGALTTAGAFTTSGSNALTLTTTGSTNVTLPTTGTLATLAGSEVFTNKTLTTPTIGSFTNATHNHQNAAGGGTLAEAALALTDVTTNNATSSAHGFLPKLSGNGAQYLAGDGTWTTPAGGGGGGGDALTTNPLSQFAATTSLQLLGVISDETGSGAVVFGTSPTIVTPTIAKLANLTTNGFVKTSGGDGTLSVDTAAYCALTGCTMTGTVTSTIGTITTSTPALSATQTWNSSGVTFTGSLLNVTNTASADASLLADWQLAGTSRFSLGRGAWTATSGTVIAATLAPTFNPSSTSTMVSVGLKVTPTINYSAGTPGGGSYEALKIAAVETATPTGTSYLIRASAGAAGTTDEFKVTNTGNITANGMNLNSGGLSGVFSAKLTDNGYFGYATDDTRLYRDAAGVLALRVSTSAQSFRVYNTFTDASNGEWATLNWASNVLHLGATKNGTGTARVMTLDYGGTTTSAISIPITSGDITFGGVLAPTGYKSSDGTAGMTGTCTIAGLTSITVKNGLITACS